MQPDPREEPLDDDDWREQAEADQEGRDRWELACAAHLAARLGNCPERAPEIERGLLQVAGLEKFDLAA